MEAIIARFPQWDKYLKVEKIDGEFVPSIEIPSPALGEPRFLCFWSDSASGPSISFGDWHDHLDLLSEGEGENKFGELFQIVDAILADELVLCWDLSCENPYPDLIEAESDLELQSGKKLKIESWSGAKDLPAPLSSDQNE